VNSTASRRGGRAAPRRSPLPLILLVVCLLAVASALSVLAASAAGGANLILADAGQMVRVGGPIVSMLTDIAGAMTLGGAVLAGWVLRVGEDRTRTLTVVSVVAGVWTLGQLLGFILSYALATGQRPTGAGFGSDLSVFLGTDVGVWLVIGLVLSAMTTTLAVTGSSTGLARTVTIAAGLGIFAKAMTGHASGGDSHEVATSTMLVHLLAVGVWVGGMMVLQLLPDRSRDDRAVITGYSRLALACWIALGLSGVWALAVRMNTPAEILTSAYVQIGLAKAMLLVVLGVIGAQQRRVLADVAHDLSRPYRRLAALEIVLMTLAVALAAAMSSSPPPAAVAGTPQSPFELLSGYPLPQTPTLGAMVTSWRPEPFFLALAAVLVLVWWRPAAPTRARGGTVRLLVSLALMLLVTNGPTAVYARALTSAHLAEHVLLLVVVGPLLASAFATPTPWRQAVQRLGRSSVGRWLLPVATAVPTLALAAVYAWPVVIRLALETHPGHLLLLVGSGLCGVVTWWTVPVVVDAIAGARPAADAGAARPDRADRPGRAGRIAAVVTLFAPVAALVACGLVVVLGDTLIAANWFGATGRSWRADALADQRQGGMVVLVFAVLELVGIALLVVRRPREGSEDQRAGSDQREQGSHVAS
jgi:putative copper export protein/cytochrome c oxidase assembly factor CtaG